MKAFFFLSFIVLAQISFAQCDKTIVMKSNKGRDLVNGSPRTEMPVEAVVTISKNKLVLTATVNSVTETLEGDISEVITCEWQQLLRQGKARFRISMRKGGALQNAILDIVGEDGQTRITFSSDPDRGTALQFDVLEYTVEE